MGTVVVSRALPTTNSPFLNILTNGGFEQWQRGNSFTTPADGTVTADKWTCHQGTATFTITKETSIIDTGAASMKVNITAAPGSSFVYLEQDLENFADYRGSTISLSIRVNASVANKIRILLSDGITSVISSYHSGGSVWQTLTATLTVAATAAQIRIAVGQLSAGTDTSTGTFYFDSAMLIFGTQAVNFQPSHPADDMARCMRYYETGHYVGFVPIFHQNPGVGNELEIWIPWKVKKSVVPTVTTSGFGGSLLHLPTTGSTISNDGANWPASPGTGSVTVNECRIIPVRNSDQTTFPIFEASFDYTVDTLT
jgi:hypothetical protein